MGMRHHGYLENQQLSNTMGASGAQMRLTGNRYMAGTGNVREGEGSHFGGNGFRAS